MKDTKTIYEQLEGTYREKNGNLVPGVALPEQKPIGNQHDPKDYEAHTPACGFFRNRCAAFLYHQP